METRYINLDDLCDVMGYKNNKQNYEQLVQSIAAKGKAVDLKLFRMLDTPMTIGDNFLSGVRNVGSITVGTMSGIVGIGNNEQSH